MAFGATPYAWLGGILLRVLPAPALARMKARLYGRRSNKVLVRAVREALSARYYQLPEDERRSLNQAEIWGGEAGRAWHQRKSELHGDEDFVEQFLNNRRPLVEALAAYLAAHPEFRQLCEIGSGNGIFLRLLAERLPTLERLVGIDLNAEQIAANRREHGGGRLQFEATGALDWLVRSGSAPLVIVACGTLEYFSEAELDELLDCLHSRGGDCLLAIYEPVNMDLGRETASKPRGNFAYSHNYPWLFERAGLRVLQVHAVPLRGGDPLYQEITVLALTVPAGEEKQ